MTTSVKAQKLPNKQETSIWAPPNIKIDGKGTEWNNKYQAFNNIVNFNYTLANNDKQLYLIVFVKDYHIIHNIMSRGLTFSISPAGSKNKKQIISTTFPILPKNVHFDLVVSSRMRDDSLSIDSIMNGNNFRFQSNSKLIRQSGIEGLDSLISIYNEDGFKAAGMFNKNREFTLELAIDLKHISALIDIQNKIGYTLRVNGDYISNYTASFVPSGNAQIDALQQSQLDSYNAKMAVQSAPSYFSGEYTLAKKP